MVLKYVLVIYEESNKGAEVQESSHGSITINNDDRLSISNDRNSSKVQEVGHTFSKGMSTQ